jgi:hypothetical protein
MTATLSSPSFSIDWLAEPELAFADDMQHIDPKVGIAAAGPYSRDEHNHRATVTAGFIGTGKTIEAARKWLTRAAEGVDGDDEHHPFPGYQASGPFASTLRVDGPEAKITAREVRALMAERRKRMDGFQALLGVIEAHVKSLSELDAPPDIVFIILPADVSRRYWSGRFHKARRNDRLEPACRHQGARNAAARPHPASG